MQITSKSKIFGPKRSAFLTVFIAFLPAFCAAQTVTVDLKAPRGPVTYRASGFIGVPFDQTGPPDALVSPLKPRMIKVGGHRGSTVHLGRAYARAVGFGAVVQRVMSQGYENEIPGVTQTWEWWTNEVTTMVNNTKNAGYRVQWDVWNEPDIEFWSGTRAQFFETWRHTVLLLRSLDPGAPIVGPSLSSFDMGWMSAFFDYAKANRVLPDIVCWHSWQGEGVLDQVNTVKSLLASKSIAITRFSINEYVLDSEQYSPSTLVAYFKGLEAAEIESAGHACWSDAEGGQLNCNNNTLNGVVTQQTPTRPRSTWWVYKSYGEMSGQLLSVNPDSGLSGLASLDPNSGMVQILLGNLGSGPEVTLRVQGIPSNAVNVTLSRIPYNGYNATPSLNSTTRSYTPSNGVMTISLSDFGAGDAYQIAFQTATSTPKRPSTPSNVGFW